MLVSFPGNAHYCTYVIPERMLITKNPCSCFTVVVSQVQWKVQYFSWNYQRCIQVSIKLSQLDHCDSHDNRKLPWRHNFQEYTLCEFSHSIFYPHFLQGSRGVSSHNRFRNNTDLATSGSSSATLPKYCQARQDIQSCWLVRCRLIRRFLCV